MRLCKPRIKPNSFAHILLGFGKLIEELLRDRKVQVGHGEGCADRDPIRSPSRSSHRQIVLVLVVVAKPQVVVRAGHSRVQFDRALEVPDRRIVFMAVVVKPPQPIRVERVFRIRAASDSRPAAPNPDETSGRRPSPARIKARDREAQWLRISSRPRPRSGSPGCESKQSRISQQRAARGECGSRSISASSSFLPRHNCGSPSPAATVPVVRSRVRAMQSTTP